MSFLQKLNRVQQIDSDAMLAPSQTAEALAKLKAEQREAAFLALQLKQAMNHQQLQLNYQANLMMPGKRVQRLSVHLIWSTTGQVIKQAELQALAHQAAHTQALCNYALTQLSQDLNELSNIGLRETAICLQLPPQLLHQSQYLANMARRCSNLGIRPEQIEFEFCLSAELAKQAEVQASLASLVQQGLHYQLTHPCFETTEAVNTGLSESARANLFASLEQGLYVLQDLDFESVCGLLYEQQSATA